MTGDTPRRHLSYKAVVAMVYVGGMFVTIMDIAIVNVALPAMSRQFDATTSSIDWVVTGYIVSLALWMPASGWIGDRFGAKRTFLFALLVFTVASALCATATSLGELVAFRVLQGIGGGLIGPVGQAMLFRVYPAVERARVSRLLIIPSLTAPTLGPIIGGFLVVTLSWRWIFLINLPVGLAGFIFGLKKLEDRREPHAGEFDLIGFVLSGIGLALLLYALSQGPSSGWGSAQVTIPAAIGALAVALFIWFELRQREPLLYLRLFASNRLFRTTNIVSLFGGAAFLGMLFVVSLFLQESRGLSPLQSGLTSFPEALGVMSGAQISGRLYMRAGPRRLMVFGLLWFSATLLVISTVGLEANLWVFRLLMYLAGAGMAFLFIPSQAAAFATITPSDMGRASALLNVQNRVANAIGVAIFATLLAAGTKLGSLAPSRASFQATLLVAAAIAGAGALIALAVKDRDAAASMNAGRKASLGGEDQPQEMQSRALGLES